MTTEQIQETITETFPEIEIKSIKKIGSGRNIVAVLVNDSVVFRIPKKEDAEFNNPDKEIKVLNFLKGKLSFEVPEILYYKKDKSGRNIIGETLVHGTTYSQEMHDSFDEETKSDILRQIGKIARELHNLGNDYSWLQDAPLHYTDSLEVFDEYFPDTVKKQFTDEQIQHINAVRDRYKYLSEQCPVKPVLTHCDLHFGNMMFDINTKKIVGLIDFGEAGYAEPSRDMHYYYGNGAKELLAGYGDTGDVYFPERQRFQSVVNLLCDIKEDLEMGKSPDRNVNKVLQIVM